MSYFTSQSSSSSTPSDDAGEGVYIADENNVIDDRPFDQYPRPLAGPPHASLPSSSASFSIARRPPATGAPSSSSSRRPQPASAREPRSPEEDGLAQQFASFFRPSRHDRPAGSPSTSSPSSPAHAPLAASLEEGMEVIKLDRHGGMKRKRLYLRIDPGTASSPPAAFVTWDSDRAKKEKAVMAVGECRLECGKHQGWFLHTKAKERARIVSSHCFSLLGEKRSLDIICKTQSDANAWIATLSSYLPSLPSLPAVTGRFLRTFTSTLPQAPLQRPQGVAISPITGEVFVCNTAASQVLVFDRASNTKAVWGRRGCGDDCFDRPSDVGVSYEEAVVYVCDTNNHRVQVLDVRGKLNESWKDDSSAVASVPAAIHVSGFSGRLYIADQTLHKVQVYASDGTFLSTIGAGHAGKEEGELSRIGGVAVWGEGAVDHRVYVVNSSAHRVDVFDTRGEFLMSFGKKGAGKGGKLFTPRGIAIDHVHRVVYVADSDNHRVQYFDLEGAWLGEWGREGPDPGEFSKPSGIAVCPLTGLVIVADTNNNRMQMFY